MSTHEERVRTQLAQWRDDLLDLTGRNRLLRFRHTKTASLELSAPDAQAILDRLTAGRSREWTIHVPPDAEPDAEDIDPTASKVALGPADRSASTAAAVTEALGRVGPDGPVHVSFGVLRWQHDGTHTAALFLVPAELAGGRLKLRAHELTVNPALVAHFQREFQFDLGEDRYRIESAGIQAAFDHLKAQLAPLDGKIDDRIGLLSPRQYEALSDGTLDVTPTVLLTEGPREGILAGLAGAERGLPVLPAKRRVLGVPVPPKPSGPLITTTKTSGKDVRAACAGLSRRATGEFMDRGIWVLYLGLGMLHWSDPADGRAEAQDSPLLLVPVRLEPGKGGAEWKLLPAEEEPLVNPALWLKLETELGIALPELDPEEPLVVAPLLAAIREAIAAYPQWAVEERVVLSTFSFHKEAMYRDLRANFDQIAAHPVVGALAGGPSDDGEGEHFDFEPVAERDLDERFTPEQAVTILDADASQRQCIAAAREGRSFVMDGPPGTGKSQTIANMIAELITHGKTVLFVSEKAAALDVVHNRLAHVGLDEYTLELHSHKTTRSAVALALGASLLRRPKPSPALTQHDLNVAAQRREALSRYAAALNEPIEALGERSLHTLLGEIAKLQHLPQAPVAEHAPATRDDADVVTDVGLASTWEVVERGEDFVWRGAATPTWDTAVGQRIRAKLEHLRDQLLGLRGVAETSAEDLLLEPPAGPHAARDLAGVLHALQDRPDRVPARWLHATDPAVCAARAAERARRWTQAGARAQDAAGPRWRDLHEPEAGDRLARLQALGAAVPTSAVEASRLAASATQLAGAAEAVHGDAGDLAALLGLRASELTLAHAEAAVELTGLAAAAALPPAAWVANPPTTSVTRVIELLEADVSARTAAQAFEPTVLELDLDALAQRFEHEHRGLKKLGGAYRADRDALAATAPTLKPKAAVAAIGAALAWKQARAALLDAATAESATLADAWAGPETEAATLRSRLELAQRAQAAAGTRVADPARFADVLSGRRAVPGAAELAGRTDAGVARLRSALPEALVPLLEQPLERAAEALREASGLLTDLAATTERVDAVRSGPGSVADAVEAAAARDTVSRIEAEHAADHEAADTLEHWAALEADPEGLTAAVAWSARTRALLPRPLPGAAAERVVSALPDPRALDQRLDRWREALEPLLQEFRPERHDELTSDLEGDFDDAAALLATLQEQRGTIETWVAYADATAALARAGLGPAVAFCVDRRVPSGQVVDVLKRSALEALADRLLQERRDVLGPLRSVDRDRLIAEYAQLDRAIVKDAAHRVMAAANARRPNAILGAAAILQSEAQKKRRHMPVSTLLAKTAPVAQAIKPCFMMSPLSVSQFLAPDMRFDVVIFDEASQVRPCDAVNALYRGDAMIVAGDQKQLPPTSFFEQTTDAGDEWVEEAPAEYDSVLDLAKGVGRFRSLSLRWHYRSQHEHLIAFSNYRFYKRDLVTFPSPAEQSEDLGVELIQVDGRYRRGTTRDNPGEAYAVAERVFAHAERGARSIGVVAFSEAQASFIEEVLRQDERRQDPRFAQLFAGDRLTALFVKNLENVQGDERDIIIFSVGYGPDEHGKLTMNFGPLNRDGGERRLNVAITRARRRVEVICSFAPEQLAPGRGEGGVDALRSYLEFAARGPVVLTMDDALDEGGVPESPFEEAVQRALQGMGHSVMSQVGTAGYRIDLAIRHPDRPGHFALGIECDGAMYHGSRVARDRDRLREQVLVGLGWKLHRIWGPSWYRDAEGETRRLAEAVERALLDAPMIAAPLAVTPPPIEVDFEVVAFDAPPPWAEPYSVAVLPAGRAFDMTEDVALAEVRQLVLHTVAEEAPIVDDLLARRVVGAWGSVVSDKRRRAVLRAVDGLVAAGTLVRRGNAVCLPSQPYDLVRIPRDGDPRTQREVKHVPDVELAEALRRLIADARLVTEEEAKQKTARLFGWSRSGSAIQAALTRVVEELSRTGQLARTGDALSPPG